MIIELDVVEAAQTLLNNRNTSIKAKRLAPTLRPQSIDDALAIQAQMTELREDGIGGWKCLLPLAEDKLVVAPIFADLVQRGESCSLYADGGVARVEPEIAFVLSQDLPARDKDYSEAEIDQAIGRCHMALELIQGRFADTENAAFFEVLADGLVNQGLFLGPEIDKAAAFSASNIEISFTQGEQTQQLAGEHPNQNPVSPIYWLINYMSKRGVSFNAGQAIITGSYAGIVELNFACETEVEYQDLGAYKLKFLAR
ncbi:MULTISPECIES: hydratase [unclassified Agarivorans]|uniref:hydratase n=1 Tax=unclassified Agarivorans TaxID=2636026 RepID=UPI003D7DFDC3